MNYNEAVHFILRETLERENAIIEAYRETIRCFVDEKNKARAVSILDSYLSKWEENRFIPSLEYITFELDCREIRSKGFAKSGERSEKSEGVIS
jgi:bacterioferritin (cytochrome b1)